MSISMYQASVPRILNMLTNLSHLLDKAQTHIEAKKLNESALTQFSLYPNMFPLVRQVQIACDTAKGAAARLAGIEAPKHEDNEATLEDLRARIAKTLAFIETVPADAIAGADERAIEIVYPSITLRFIGRDYLTKFVLPNLYFHVTMTYAILRANGVAVGKGDYLGNIF